MVTSSTDDGTLSAAVAGSPLSVVFGNGLLSTLAASASAGIGAPSTAYGDLLPPTGDDVSVSTISDNGLIFLVTGDVGSISAVSGNGPLSSVIGGIDSTFAISSGSFFSFIADNGFLFPTTSSVSLSASSSALSLSGILFYACCPFLASLAVLFAGFVTPITKKRLFDEAFIKRRLFASIQQKEKLDLSFG